MNRIFAAVCRAAQLASVQDCQPWMDRWFAAVGWIAVAGLTLVLLEWIIPRRAGRPLRLAVRGLGHVLLIVGVAGTFGTNVMPPPAAIETNAQLQTNDALQKIAIAQLMDENLKLQASLEREKERRQGRALLKDQFEALQAVRGKLPRASIIAPNNPEAIDFANDIILALIAAGVDVRMRVPPPGFTASASTIWSSKTDDPVMDAFTKARLAPAWKNLATLSFPDIPRDIPLIAIGDRPLDAPKPGAK